MSEYYLWIPNSNACEICLRMASRRHTERPDRPHPRCLCSIVHVNDDSKEADCFRESISIQRSQYMGQENEISDGKVQAIVHEWNFTAICRDNTVVDVNVNVRIDGSELDRIYDEIDQHGFDRGYELTQEAALREAMDEIESMCPDCSNKQS